ncbi:hypothetical protein [Haloarchaeobius sp. DFWS5]|uniref:NfeD family protein n=1 Tax=Haloarchaeobius sp. DFWS5 TaxID=3446114 RepID=UPI003EBDADE9
MDAKQTLKLVSYYRALAFLSFAVGALFIALGVYLGLAEASQYVIDDFSRARETANLMVFVVLTLVGLFVWQVGKSIAMVRTVDRAMAVGGAAETDQQLKSEVLDVVNDQLSSMEADLRSQMRKNMSDDGIGGSISGGGSAASSTSQRESRQSRRASGSSASSGSESTDTAGGRGSSRGSTTGAGSDDAQSGQSGRGSSSGRGSRSSSGNSAASDSNTDSRNTSGNDGTTSRSFREERTSRQGEQSSASDRATGSDQSRSSDRTTESATDEGDEDDPLR